MFTKFQRKQLLNQLSTNFPNSSLWGYIKRETNPKEGIIHFSPN
jgi:hypothetical protein